MSVESVFKSTHPDVLAEYERFTTQADEQRAYALALAEHYGGRQALRLSSHDGLTIVGLSTIDGDKGRHAPRTRDDLPGLRLGVKEGYWCPDKRTVEGRALAKAWTAARVRRPDYAGMPDEVWADSGGFQSYIYRPGSTLIDGALYVTWGCGADRLIEGRTDDLTAAKRADAVDLDVWEHVRLSEWHALQEAREAAEAGV